MSAGPKAGGTVALGLVLGLVSILCGLAAGALLVAAAVVGLAPVIGTGWALVAVAAGLLAGIGVVAAVMAAAVRRARARRRVALPVAAVLEMVLALVPRRRVAQLEAALVAGVALGTLVLGALETRRGA